MSKPALHSPAPDFQAPVVGGDYSAGATVRLSDLQGKPVVLYFYPKDDTPGCTKQACSLRDHWGSISTSAHVFGVSIDPVKSHEKFIKKHSLPFPLLADEDQAIVDAYGVWVEKSMYGKTYMGTERSSFVIDAEGNIAAILEKVKPGEHLDQVKAALAELA
jgi:peroxiredoxin Q/BCP